MKNLKVLFLTVIFVIISGSASSQNKQWKKELSESRIIEDKQLYA